MSEIHHWHPVVLSRKLKSRPQRALLGQRAVVVFRDGDGVGVLDEACPHRGMRLSEGRVVDGRLVCPYHSWSFDRRGQGRSPGDPSVNPSAACMEVREQCGAVWARVPRLQHDCPRPHDPGLHAFRPFQRTIHAPVEVVLDNFAEVEHTPTVHIVGFDPARMEELDCQVEVEDERVLVQASGPQKPGVMRLRRLLGLGPEWRYTVRWSVNFSPLHIEVEHAWMRAGECFPERFKAWVFFNPTGSVRTQVTTFPFSTTPPHGAVNRLLRRAHLHLVELEIDRDRRLISKMEAAWIGTPGRFDEALLASRQRLDTLYRGAQS